VTESNLKIKLSVVVPVFNEEATIQTVIERVTSELKIFEWYELIIVDDGSSDNTLEQIRAVREKVNVVISLPRNEGKGKALIEGFARASGDYVLVQDADLEYDPADFAALCGPIQKHSADLVLGSRLSAPPVTRVYYFWHKMGNQFLTTFFNVLFNTTFTDIYCGYLVFRRKLIEPEKLRVHGWGQQAEILAAACKKRARLFEVPVNYYGRTYEEGKKIRANNALAVIATMVACRIRS
jgi:glycosyltransferase involved in cell wall biosynthesis